jgi:LemA protein
MAYNNRREVFPASLVANNFGFKPAALLEIPVDQRDAVRAAPKVQF